MTNSILIIVPCLNEAVHIEHLLEKLGLQLPSNGCLIVVADGGSYDGTVDLVNAACARSDRIRYLHNPRKIQSAAVNLAVKTYGHDFTYFVRIDAHAAYPDNFIKSLLVDAKRTGAHSVVVSMKTTGHSPKQKAIAVAQNSILGNGGSVHRKAGQAGQWVDHAHHALMEIAMFEGVGGYDERFSHNEDAELDYRIRLAGGKIWLTNATQIDYFPRETLTALARQYFGFGAGRVRTLIKHRILPKSRQAIPIFVVPAICLTGFSAVTWVAALPVTIWMCCVIAAGAVSALQKRETRSLHGVIWVTSALIVLQAFWSLGACKTIIWRHRN